MTTGSTLARHPLGAFAAMMLLAATPARAVELDGVTMPDTLEVAGTRLVLNGVALRTYSILHVHVYVAALYLAHPSSDAEAILDSKDTKSLRFVFARDVEAERARDSWRESLEKSCQPPCRLVPQDVERFLAAIPTVHKGDVSTLVFSPQGLDFFVNDHPAGRVTDQGFVRLILSTFIGPHPTADSLKHGLLGRS